MTSKNITKYLQLSSIRNLTVKSLNKVVNNLKKFKLILIIKHKHFERLLSLLTLFLYKKSVL